MMGKLLKVMALFTAFGVAAIYFGVEHLSNAHQSNIKKVYEFAGRDYLENDPHVLNIQYTNPIHSYLAGKFTFTGPMINSALLSKKSLKEAGLDKMCGEIEYLNILRDDIDESVFIDSGLCCAPNIASQFTPIIYDEREDRVLAICGVADDAHVIAMGADKYNTMLTFYLHGIENFDVRKAHDLTSE